MPIDRDEDEMFDAAFPPWMRVQSAVHLTPISVAKEAARLLAPDAGMRVLDVGAGPGKFCVVAATEVPEAIFVGVEIRPHLVHMARKLANRAGVDNVRFIHANAIEIAWSEYDAFYLYNPFAEQLYGDNFMLDRFLDRDPSRFDDYVIGVRRHLARARIGTRVVTYHGFGAPAPQGYDLAESRDVGSDRLELWVKVRHPAEILVA